jgi:hypothetical protein
MHLHPFFSQLRLYGQVDALEAWSKKYASKVKGLQDRIIVLVAAIYTQITSNGMSARCAPHHQFLNVLFDCKACRLIML